MTSTPKGFRLHIGIFGRRNAGKSTLMNLLAGQAVSLVSDTPGTTADPVEKPLELPPLGPVLLIDTAGIDDVGGLGEMRSGAARRIFDRVDLAVVVLADPWSDFETSLRDEFKTRGVPLVVVLNKSDAGIEYALPPESAAGQTTVRMAASRGEGLEELRLALVDNAPRDFIDAPPLLADILPPGSTAVLVVPIDKEAPKGRLILPQAQIIRDLLDHNSLAVVATDDGLERALASLREPPGLVVTDSQAFRKVAAIVPPDVPLTGFSIIFARARGDLAAFAAGAAAIRDLKPGDEVIIAESCTHHSLDDDIGRVKIPAWLNRTAGGELRFRNLQGHDFPRDFGEAKLIVHCGACMTNRREILSRIARARAAGVAVTNYGMCIAYCLGLLERALEPFPAAMAAFRAAR